MLIKTCLLSALTLLGACKGPVVSKQMYDAFAQVAPSGDAVVVPVHVYELFKGIALESINKERTAKLEAKDLTLQSNSKGHFFKQFPKFLYRTQTGFTKPVEALGKQAETLSRQVPIAEKSQAKDVAKLLKLAAFDSENLENFLRSLEREVQSVAEPLEQVISELVGPSESSYEPEYEPEYEPTGRYDKPLETYWEYNGNYTYEGEWLDYGPDGKGVKTNSEGTYEGYFRRGWKHGRGTFTYANGDSYEGEWQDDSINGRGLFRYANGDTHEGSFQYGSPHGLGVRTNQAQGYTFIGEFASQYKNGFGIQLFDNGDVFIGQFSYDSIRGEGTYFYANGDRFEGNYEYGYLNGEVLHTHSCQQQKKTYSWGIEQRD